MSETEQNSQIPTDNKKNADDSDETLTHVSDLNDEESKKQIKPEAKTDEKEHKRKKFYQEELLRLKKCLEDESSKIKPPPVQEHVPYCFNTLKPYYDTSTAVHVIIKAESDEKDVLSEYATRQTAIGLVDPWVDHKMDTEIAPKIKVKEPSPFRTAPKKEKRIGEGSTMIPAFPTVNLNTGDLETRRLDYNDVPLLRKELKEKYSSQAKEKIDKDYERTKVDFYRMELHKLNDVHPINRENMRAAYFAYLQNNPGSKKAVKECIKQL